MLTLTADPTGLSDALSTRILTILNPLITSSSANYDLKDAFNILSNLLKGAGESSTSTLAESIQTEVERVAGFALTAGTDLLVESSKISLKVSTLDTSA